MRSFFCTFLIVLAILLLSAALHAQSTSPAATPPSLPSPVADSISTWPTAATLKRGSHLLITTDRNFGGTYECKLESIDDRGIGCRGSHGKPVVYERSMVRTIGLRSEKLRNAFVVLAIGSGALVIGSLACIAAGGAGVGCLVLLETSTLR